MQIKFLQTLLLGACVLVGLRSPSLGLPLTNNVPNNHIVYVPGHGYFELVPAAPDSETNDVPNNNLVFSLDYGYFALVPVEA